jgi:hypothetical protein
MVVVVGVGAGAAGAVSLGFAVFFVVAGFLAPAAAFLAGFGGINARISAEEQPLFITTKA